MKRLILVRHAKTERRAVSGEDFDRELTEEGRRAAPALAEALERAGLIPDLALVSAALRARQTFELMQPHLPDVRQEVRRDLYDAAPAALQAAAEAADATSVMVVAHNPGVHLLALFLAKSATAVAVEHLQALEQGFPTSTAAAFEVLDGRIGCLGVFRPGAPG